MNIGVVTLVIFIQSSSIYNYDQWFYLWGEVYIYNSWEYGYIYIYNNKLINIITQYHGHFVNI